MSERDYFVSTCLKAGSVASWGFSPPPTPRLFTQSVRRHTRACWEWVFASEPGQGFQRRALALPPRRHREARSVTRPRGASSLSAYPPFTSSSFLAAGPRRPWAARGGRLPAGRASPAGGGLPDARARETRRGGLGWGPWGRSLPRRSGPTAPRWPGVPDEPCKLWMSSTSGEVSGGQPFWKSASGVFSWGRRAGLRLVWGGSAERSPPASAVLQSVVRPSVTQPQHPLGTC